MRQDGTVRKQFKESDQFMIEKRLLSTLYPIKKLLLSGVLLYHMDTFDINLKIMRTFHLDAK